MKKTTASALTLGAVILALLPGCSTNTQGDDAAPVLWRGRFRDRCGHGPALPTLSQITADPMVRSFAAVLQ